MTMLICGRCGCSNSDLNLRCSECGSSLPEASSDACDPRIGSRLGRYTIGKRLGAGGMGVVYEATDGNQRFALKLIARELAERAEVQARFAREARIAGALQHPNIGVIHGVEQYADEVAIVMALYEGETLRRRITGGPLAVGAAVEIASQVAAGLAAAHDAGVIHRDVKPANVFLSEGDGVKLLDFGLAKSIDAQTRSLTTDGALVGTVAYMAPEQLAGDRADARSDLWAFGVLVYEMIAGFPPFGARAGRMLGDRPIPIRNVAPGAPRYLDRLVMRLLQRDPADRPASMAEVLTALRSQRVPARGKRRRLPGKRRSHRRRIAAIFAMAVLGSAAIVGGVSRGREGPELPAGYVEGIRRLRLDDFAAAAAALERTTILRPDFAPGWLALARARAGEVDIARAKQAVARAAGLIPVTDRAHRLEVEGLAAEIDENWEVAFDRYQAYFRFFPEDVDVGLALAEAQSRGARPRDALATVQALGSISGDGRLALAEAKAASLLVDWPRCRAAATRAITFGAAHGALEIVARGLLRRGPALGALGEHGAALADVRTAGAILERIGDRRLQAVQLTQLTLVLREAGDVAGAADAAARGIAIDRELGEPHMLAGDLLNTASALSELGDPAQAGALYREAFAVLRKLNDRTLLATALLSYGQMLTDIGERAEADRALRESIQLSRAAGYEQLVGLALGAIAWNDFGLGNVKQSESEAREAATIAERLGDTSNVAMAYEQVASALAAQGELAEAVRAAEQATRLAESLDPMTLATERAWYAVHLVDAGQYVRAAELALQAAEVLRERKMKRDELTAHAVAALALASLGRSAEARAQLELGRALLERPLPVDCRANAAVLLLRAALRLGARDEAQAIVAAAPRERVAIPWARALSRLAAQTAPGR